MDDSTKGPFRATTNGVRQFIVVDDRTGVALCRTQGRFRKFAITHQTMESAEKKADRLNREWREQGGKVEGAND